MTSTEERHEHTSDRASFWRPFLVLVALGLIGIVSLIPLAIAQRDVLPVAIAEMPLWAIILITMADPLLFLLIAVPTGLVLAHRVGLVSLLVDRVRDGVSVWPCLRPQLPLAIVLGLIVGASIVGLEILSRPVVDFETAEPALDAFPRLLLGMLYGGITEEFLLRWGLMTLFVWIGWRVFDRQSPTPGAAVFWLGIVVAAVAFGAAHLPAVAAATELTFPVVVRTIALNALGGVVFGWLFWRRSLEAAMVAHASAHIAFALLALIGT